LRGEVRRIETEHRLARMRNHELAQLIGFAFHDPKKMPKFEDSTEGRKAISNEVANAKVRGFLIALSQKKTAGRG